MNQACEAFWHQFLIDTGRPLDTPCYGAEHFCDNEQDANDLLSLVLAGKKRATSSCLRAYEAEGIPLPAIGCLTLLTDYAGTPKCVYRTTNVTILPFHEITFDIAKREGEDEVLDTWVKTTGAASWRRPRWTALPLMKKRRWCLRILKSSTRKAAAARLFSPFADAR